jgi:hypothetical protein
MVHEKTNMDTRNFNGSDTEITKIADPWGSDRDVANHAARDERAAAARSATHEQIAIPTGQAVLRLPDFASLHAPLVHDEAPLKRDRVALRRREKHSLFGKRA